MRGEAELLLSKPRPNEEYQRGLANNIEKLDFLTRMINDLILLSKFDSNEAGLEMAPVKLDELLANLWELFRVLAEQKGIRFTLGEIEQANVLGDRTRFQQLFTNLIDNAIKFTPSGGHTDMSLEKGGGFARVAIRDTGIGIPKEEFEHIFERFYRVDKSRDRVKVLPYLVLSEKEIKLELKLPPGERGIVITGKPIWYELASKGSISRLRVGVLFTDMTREARDTWVQFIKDENSPLPF